MPDDSRKPTAHLRRPPPAAPMSEGGADAEAVDGLASGRWSWAERLRREEVPRAWRFLGSFWPISKLTRRVLTINLLALAVPIGGMLYLGEYRRGLITDELERVRIEAGAVSAAIGASAVTWGEGDQYLLPETTRTLLGRMLADSPTRAQLFALDGTLDEDTRLIEGGMAEVEIETLPPPGGDGLLRDLFDLYDRVFDGLSPLEAPPPLFREPERPAAADYPEVVTALGGETISLVRRDDRDRPVFFVATPVQHYRKVLGAMLLSRTGESVDQAVTEMRLAILRISGLGLAVTVLLSLYLAGTITRPVRRLARAADRVRLRQGRIHGDEPIPDFAGRRDEIGDLSTALREMTDALSARIVAIERFAADVAHEVKNPLTSLRSAMETATRITGGAPSQLSPRDREKIDRLFDIMQQDVARMDRLISDISDASRVDAELFRNPGRAVDLKALVERLAEASELFGETPPLLLESAPVGPVSVLGLEDRLTQALLNLIANARSFSPPGGTVRLSLAAADGQAEIVVEDDGPGIPDGNLDRIFERFYTERPEREPFGDHSGLGLSICRQIIEAHGGEARAENRRPGGPETPVMGARFRLRLPLLT